MQEFRGTRQAKNQRESTAEASTQQSSTPLLNGLPEGRPVNDGNESTLRSRFPSGHADQTQQTAYLERHNLLTDAERKGLPVDAFEPVRYVKKTPL